MSFLDHAVIAYPEHNEENVCSGDPVVVPSGVRLKVLQKKGERRFSELSFKSMTFFAWIPSDYVVRRNPGN